MVNLRGDSDLTELQHRLQLTRACIWCPGDLFSFALPFYHPSFPQVVEMYREFMSLISPQLFDFFFNLWNDIVHSHVYFGCQAMNFCQKMLELLLSLRFSLNLFLITRKMMS